MTATTAVRVAALALLVSGALVLQTTVFPHLAVHGVVPDLVLLVVVGCGLARGPQHVMVLGFAAGTLLDLAPPADHVAGRWALSLVLVGYVVGLVRPEPGSGRAGALPGLLAAGVGGLVGASVFAMSGLVLHDPSVPVGRLLEAVALSVGWDLLAAPFVLPLVLAVLGRLEPRRTPGVVRA